MKTQIVPLKSQKCPVRFFSETPNAICAVENLHIHAELELLYVSSGKMQVWTNGQELVLEKDEIIFINSRTPHVVQSLEPGTRHLLVQFANPSDDTPHLQHLSIFLKSAGNSLYVFNKSDPDYAELSSYIFNIFKKRDECISSDYYITANIYNIWALLYKKHILISLEDLADISSLEKMFPIFEYIDKNFSQQITIHELATHIGLNKDYFCKQFKKLTGLTVVDYINFVRILKAESLLKTQMSISEILYQTGFSSHSYFNHVFRKYNHCSPTTYRKICGPSK